MKTLFLLFTSFFSMTMAHAQFHGVWDGLPLDSAVISFDDNLPSRMSTGIKYSLDTAHATLWRVGSTSKPFFASGGAGHAGIMTDTAAPYTVRANDWFGLKLSGPFVNPIISFTHKYQTSALHDGGVVEYSFDSSIWSNVVGGCYPLLLTDSFYKAADTIAGAIPAFSGTGLWKRSRFQFFQGIPIKVTGACLIKFPLYVRFRFISDTTADTLAGWIIRNITIERDQYNGSVPSAGLYPSLDVRPNPAPDGRFYWPALEGEFAYSITITDVAGKQVFNSRYARYTDCHQLQPGLYFYHVSNGAQQFTGKLLR